ncbi:MAG: hypothetical protein COZ74_04175, partial [Flavobacteriaceae bacterium CG_4_8_14_3_um_filter_31_8]
MKENNDVINKMILDLSICIPAYNYAQYLPFAIESCLATDFDFELVVVDNCSKDHTNQLKSKYVHDNRVKWYTNTETLPLVQNWNHTVSLGSRKYVKLLLADDYLEPNFFTLFQEAITKYPDQAIYGHLIKIIDKDNVLQNIGVPYSKSEKYFLVKGVRYIQMKLQSIARFKETSCNFFLKEKWAEIGGFDEKFSFSFDLVFNSTLAFNYGGCLISEHAACLRRHSQADNLNKKPDLSVKEMNIIVTMLFENLSSEIRKTDFLFGKSMLQYRIIELLFQRFKK